MIKRKIMNRFLSTLLFIALIVPWLLPERAPQQADELVIAVNVESSAAAPAPVAPKKPTNLVEAIAYVGPDLGAFAADDDTCLAQAIYFEARSESLEGQLAVAQVVLNRVNHSRYPNTVCGVVFQNEHLRHRCQFSFACDGRSDRPRESRAWETAQRVGLVARKGYVDDITNRATHYHADYVSPAWGKALEPTVRHGRHQFYRIASRNSAT